MGHIYKDLEIITGEQGLMTHMLPRVCDAIEPWLKEHVTDQRFWDGEYDATHTGNIEIPTTSKEDKEAMLKRFK